MMAGVRSETNELSINGGHVAEEYACTSDANSFLVCERRRWAQSSTLVMAGGSPVGMWGRVGELDLCPRVGGGGSPGGV